MKNLSKKSKKIILIVLSIILLLSVCVFIKNKHSENIVKNPDKAINELLNVFYTDNYNQIAANILLNKNSNEYFESLRKELYSRVYNQLKELGTENVIENEDIVKIANEYADENLELLKRVKDFKIEDKAEIENGYLFTISITPDNLSQIYDLKNTCIQKETKAYKESNYQALINYYCAKEAMKAKTSGSGTANIITITLTKNKKGYYIPDQESLTKLLSVIM